MKLALIGNGAMGQMVAGAARKAGDEICVVLTSKEGVLPVEQLTEKLRGHDVAVDFSIGEAVLKNVAACVHEKRSDLLCAVEEELQQRRACPADGTMARRIARVGRRTFRKRLRQQIGAVLRECRG